jgi:hypothetical protein
MTLKKLSGMGWTGAAALCAALVGCGAGESSGSAVTGVAMSQAPISGTVTLRDSSAEVQRRTVSTRADGSFAFDVQGLTPPFQVQVDFDDAGLPEKLLAVAEGGTSLDVNPITDTVFAVASDRSGEDDEERSEAEERRETSRRARGVLVALRTVLAPLFERYGITDPARDRARVKALLEDVRIRRDDGIVQVVNRETGGVIFEGPLRDLASGIFYPENMPAGPGEPPPPPATCSSFTYTDWSACGADGRQTRTVVSSAPAGCTGGSPVLSQTCTPPGPVACTGFTYSPWSACVNGTQSRTVLTATPSGCTGGNPVLSQTCTPPPPPPVTCTAFTYSAWGTCGADGRQTRTVVSSSPAGCTGGTPVLSQACTPPPVTCTAFTYSAWGTCGADGTQTRTVLSSTPAGCTGGSPVLSQTCTPPPPPPQSCTTCHGTPPSSGRHSRHAFTSCGTCHSGYTATTANAATHMNGVRDVNTAQAGWNPTTRTCATSCHGSRTW